MAGAGAPVVTRAGASSGIERPRHWLPIAALAAVVGVGISTLILAQNPRVVVSWHGFLHSAIANRYPGPFATPENPFFAGERLPYYWLHQDLASMLARGLGTHPILSLQVLSAAGLVALWIGAVALGVYRLKSVPAGLLIGFLLIAGVNPLGPVIAVSKAVLLHQPLFDSGAAASADTVFVTEKQSAGLLAHPLLGAIYVGGDWRRGQNVPWFLDLSSRGLALGFLPALLLAVSGARLSVLRSAAIVVVAGFIAALNPLIGVAAIGALAGGTVLVVAMKRLSGERDAGDWRALGAAAAAVAGLLLVSPTFIHLFGVGGAGMQILSVGDAAPRAIAIAVNEFVLLLLALGAVATLRGSLGDQSRVLAFGGYALLAVAPFIVLTDDTDHNFTNTAQCLLVFPAVAFLASRDVRPRTYALVAALFVPTTAATLGAYLGHPALPIRFDGPLIHRTEPEALEQMYAWARTATPASAVFVADPAAPVKMSGNVAELPSFTGRTLFVDAASYMTSPHLDFARRIEIASRLTGASRSGDDAAYVRALGRPTYLVSYHADQEPLAAALTAAYGAPVFRREFVAVFDLESYLRTAGASGPSSALPR